MRRRAMAGIVVATALLLIGMPAAVANDTETTDGADEAVHETKPERPPPLAVSNVEAVLPVLGSQLTITIKMGESGVIESVALDRDATVVKQGEHRVVYELAGGGTFALVKAGPHRVTAKIRSSSIADVTGPGTWTADVFGNGAVAIGYTVTTDPDGNPTIAVNGVTPPPGVQYDIGDPKTRSSDRGAKTKVVVSLISGDETARVVFTVSSRQKKDGTVKATLAVSLSNWRGHKFHHARWKDSRDDKAWSGERRNTRASNDDDKKASRDSRDGRRDRQDGRDGRRDGRRGERFHSKSDG